VVADMTTTPDGSETTVADRATEIQSRYGTDDLVSRFIRLAWENLNATVSVRSVAWKRLGLFKRRRASMSFIAAAS
jgi:hypothetical protein